MASTSPNSDEARSLSGDRKCDARGTESGGNQHPSGESLGLRHRPQRVGVVVATAHPGGLSRRPMRTMMHAG